MIGSKKQIKFSLKSFLKKEKGLTLVEMLVGISIFSLIIAGVFNLFNAQLQSQTKSLKEASLFDNLSYNLEYMSRALRMAQRDDGTCITSGYTFQKVGTGVEFKNYKGECQYFYLDSGVLKEQIDSQPAVNLTPSNIEVELFNITLSGQSRTDDYQPKVTLSLKVKINHPNPIYQNPIYIQTTISARNLDLK